MVTIDTARITMVTSGPYLGVTMVTIKPVTKNHNHRVIKVTITVIDVLNSNQMNVIKVLITVTRSSVAPVTMQALSRHSNDFFPDHRGNHNFHRGH